MADIFISYAREDETRIRELVRALEKHGWSIFWDRRIPTGKTWQSYIGQALSDARLVIVSWSHHSITSDWVIEEANDAKERGCLVPILLDPVKPPLGFRGIQAADLTDWKPSHSSPYFDQLIQDIAGIVGGKPDRPMPEEELPGQTQSVAPPGSVLTEPPPQKPAPPKPEPPKVQPHEPKAIKPESREAPKKRNNFLVGVMITMALVIVVGLAVWFSQETKTRPVEPPVAKAPEAPPKAPTQRTFTNSIGMSFVLIPAGSFTMGSPTNEPGRDADERQHPVTISKPFYLQTTEVTQKQWKGVMGSNPSNFKDCGDCPVERVSWNDAQEFIRKLNQKESGARYLNSISKGGLNVLKRRRKARILRGIECPIQG